MSRSPGGRSASPPKQEWIIDGNDIIELAKEIGVDPFDCLREVRDYLDEGGDKSIRQVHRNCSNMSTFWDHPTGYSDGISMTLSQFWRIAAVVGLPQIATLAELSHDVNPKGAAKQKQKAPFRKMSVDNLARGLAIIAAKRTTCAQVAVQFGMGLGDTLAERLAALVTGINAEVGRLLDAGEPLESPGAPGGLYEQIRATTLFRVDYARGISRVLKSVCDDAGTAPLFTARKILLIVDALSPNLSSGRVMGTAAIAAQALSTAAPRTPAENGILELMGFDSRKLTLHSSAHRMRVTASELIDAFARYAVGACPQLDRAAAIKTVWNPFLSSDPSSALGHQTLLSFLQPPAGASKDIQRLLHEAFLHYASFGWHEDATKVGGMEMRHAAWRAIKTQLGLSGDDVSMDDAAFYACAVGGVTSLSDKKVVVDAPAVLEEDGLLSALRMLGARSILEKSGFGKPALDSEMNSSETATKEPPKKPPPPPLPKENTKEKPKDKGKDKVTKGKVGKEKPDEKPEEVEVEDIDEDDVGMDDTGIAIHVDELLEQRLRALNAFLGLSSLVRKQRDVPSRLRAINSCSAAAEILKQYTEPLALLFHAYSEPLEPRVDTFSGGLAADAEFSTAPLRRRRPTDDEDDDEPYQASTSQAQSSGPRGMLHTALEAELRGIGPQAFMQLVEDFDLSAMLRCDGATASKLAAQMGGRPLSLLQLLIVLLRMTHHGASALTMRRVIEDDGIAAIEESGRWVDNHALYMPKTPFADQPTAVMEAGSVDEAGARRRATTAWATSESPMEAPARFLESAVVDRPAHISVEAALSHVLTRLLMLDRPLSIRNRLLGVGRRLIPASVLLPLPEQPQLFPRTGLEGLRLSQEELARRLHALIALADADDPRLWGAAISAAATTMPSATFGTPMAAPTWRAPPTAPTTSNYAATALLGIVTNKAAAAAATARPITSPPLRRPRSLLWTNSAIAASAASMPMPQSATIPASKSAGLPVYASMLRPPSSLTPPPGWTNVAGMPGFASMPGGNAATIPTASIARSLHNTDVATSVPAEAGRLLCEPLETPPLPSDVARLVHEGALYSADGDLRRALSAIGSARTLLFNPRRPPIGILASSSSPTDAVRSSSGLPGFTSPDCPPAAAIFLELSMARACSNCGQPAQALRHAGSAFFLAIAMEPGDVLCHADIACALASICCELRRYEVAGALFARALEARISRGCPAVAVGEAMNNLAVCASATGDIPTSVQLYRDCHALLVSEVQPSHESVARLLHNLSRQLRLSGSSLTTRPPVHLHAPLRAPPVLASQMCIPPKAGAKKGGKKGGGKKGGGKKGSGKKKK